MPSTLRHLIAVVLLVLLPLQAIAAVYTAGLAPIVAGSDATMALGWEHDDDTGATCQAAVCAAAASVAPPLARVVRMVTAPRQALLPLPAQLYTSYVPDGPQRPPRTRS